MSIQRMKRQVFKHLSMPTKKMVKTERIEQEYYRCGDSGLIVYRTVTDGKTVEPLIQPTRTEMDFVKHLRDVVSLDPKAGYRFVMDNLNTHIPSMICN